MSGLYVAHLVRDDTGGESQIIFVVREDSSHSDIVLKTSDSTWQAYNAYGGNSLYTCTVSCPDAADPGGYKAAYAVSYNRPFDGTLPTDSGLLGPVLRRIPADPVPGAKRLRPQLRLPARSRHERLAAEKPQGLHRQRPRRVLVPGRAPERRSRPRRRGEPRLLQRQRDLLEDPLGGELRRIEHALPHADHLQGHPLPGTGGPGRAERNDWNLARSALQPAGRCRPPRKQPHRAVLPGQLRDGRNQGPRHARQAALLAEHGGVDLEPVADSDTGPGNRDAGVRVGRELRQRLPARRPDPAVVDDRQRGSKPSTDYGTNVEDGATATHSLSLYRAPSGALVFGAGTVQWSWGLDVTNAWNRSRTGRLRPRSDHAAGDGQPPGGHGCSADDAPVRPGRREQIDGHHATEYDHQLAQRRSGAERRQYGDDLRHGVRCAAAASLPPSKFRPTGAPHGTPRTEPPTGPTRGPSTAARRRRSRPAPSTTRATSGLQAREGPCPCPARARSSGKRSRPNADSGDSSSVELGVKFRSDVPGTINGIRFYKATANSGTHVGSLWTSSGTLLAQATFSERDGIGLAAGELLQPRLDPGKHDLCGGLLRAERALLGNGARPQPSAGRRGRQPRQPTSAHPSRQRQRQRALPVHQQQRLPKPDLPGRELLGRRLVRTHRPRPAARPGDERQRHRRTGPGRRRLDATHGRRGPLELPDHPLHRLHRPEPDHGRRSGRLEDDRRPQTPAPPTPSRSPRSTPPGQARSRRTRTR